MTEIRSRWAVAPTYCNTLYYNEAKIARLSLSRLSQGWWNWLQNKTLFDGQTQWKSYRWNQTLKKKEKRKKIKQRYKFWLECKLILCLSFKFSFLHFISKLLKPDKRLKEIEVSQTSFPMATDLFWGFSGSISRSSLSYVTALSIWYSYPFINSKTEIQYTLSWADVIFIVDYIIKAGN